MAPIVDIARAALQKLERLAPRAGNGLEQCRGAVTTVRDGFERDGARRAAREPALETAEALGAGGRVPATAAALVQIATMSTHGRPQADFRMVGTTSIRDSMRTSERRWVASRSTTRRAA